MTARYEKEAYQYLATFRFLSYALAVMFTVVGPSSFTPSSLSGGQMYIILGVLGVYSILKVFSPLRWRERSYITYVILFGDFLLSILLVIYTGGLYSAFLLYSLTPIMTAALLFQEGIALSLAAFATIALSVSHLALTHVSERLVWLMQGHNLTLLFIYAMFGFAVAIVPYRINLNIRRRIEGEAIIGERRRIARELHDGIAQSLGYLNLKTKTVSNLVAENQSTKALNELNDVRKIVQDTYEDIRESIDQLSGDIKNVSLVAELTNYTAEFSANNGIKVTFNKPGNHLRMSPVAELQLLRIAQESLTNVRRHAEATEVELSLSVEDGIVEMLIRDNGKGFQISDVEDPPPGYHGLNIIKERAEALEGEFSIVTSPGEGTAISVALPLEKVRF